MRGIGETREKRSCPSLITETSYSRSARNIVQYCISSMINRFISSHITTINRSINQSIGQLALNLPYPAIVTPLCCFLVYCRTLCSLCSFFICVMPQPSYTHDISTFPIDIFAPFLLMYSADLFARIGSYDASVVEGYATSSQLNFRQTRSIIYAN